MTTYSHHNMISPDNHKIFKNKYFGSCIQMKQSEINSLEAYPGILNKMNGK